jgi:hypothetical protein
MLQVNDNLKHCHLLLEEANLITMADAPMGSKDCLNLLNEHRSKQNWPLASGMCCIQADIANLIFAGDFDLTQARSILQAALIDVFKQQEGALEKLSTALNTIRKTTGNHVFSDIAEQLIMIFSNFEQFTHEHAVLSCLRQYDLLLSAWQRDSLAEPETEKLYLDVCFYAQQIAGQNPLWADDEVALQHQAKRTQYFAGKLAELLVATDNEVTLAKEKLMPTYLGLTDGLLFGNHFELRARIEARFQKLDQLDDPMLLIAVPAQKLWAECKRITVNL